MVDTARIETAIENAVSLGLEIRFGKNEISSLGGSFQEYVWHNGDKVATFVALVEDIMEYR